MIYLHPTIIDATWIDPLALSVRFASHETARRHQVYVGRRLRGQTISVTDRTIVTTIVPSRWPQWLTVVAIDNEDAGLDRGTWLPPRPYNVVQVSWNTADWTGDPHQVDVRQFELYRGQIPDGAIDYNTIISSELATTSSANYTVDSDPLPGSGDWNLGLLARDRTLDAGNAGNAYEFTESVLATPPDFDSPFTATATAGVLNIAVTIPTD